MTYEAIELTKYDQQLAKEIPCDYHLHKHDVTKQNKKKNTQKRSRSFLYTRP